MVIPQSDFGLFVEDCFSLLLLLVKLMLSSYAAGCYAINRSLFCFFAD